MGSFWTSFIAAMLGFPLGSWLAVIFVDRIISTDPNRWIQGSVVRVVAGLLAGLFASWGSVAWFTRHGQDRADLIMELALPIVACALWVGVKLTKDQVSGKSSGGMPLVVGLLALAFALSIGLLVLSGSPLPF